MQNRDGGDGGFAALAGILWRRLWLIALAFIVAVAAALVYAQAQQKKYDSTAVLLFKPVYLDVELTGTTLQLPSSDPTVDSATNVGLVSEQNVRAGAAATLGAPYTPLKLLNQVSIAPQSQSDLVGITASANTPQEAARVANAMAQSYLQIARQQIGSDISRAESQVVTEIGNKSLPKVDRTALETALVKLKVLEALGPQNVHLVQPGVPATSPSSPKRALDAVIGGLIGLVIGLALALGLEQADKRVRTPDELELESGLPLLATIERSKGFRRGPGAVLLDPQDSEPFRQLASKLRHRPRQQEIRSVLVTSPGAGSGKTTVALHLAVASSDALHDEVLLLEADLRRPALGQLLHLPTERGLSTLALSDQSGGPAVQTLEWAGDRSVDNSNRSLSLVLSGPPTDNAARVLESDPVRALIENSRDSYDLTVIDGPPVGLVADAVPIATSVDAVVIVARLGKDTGPEIRRLRVELQRLGIEPIGIVANFARRQKNPYTTSKRS